MTQARQALQQGDVAGAERLLTPLFQNGQADHPAVLLLAGLIRLQQGRIPEAEAIFAQGRTAAPGDAVLAYYHGAALAALKRNEEAATRYRAAIAMKPDLAEARLALSALLIESGHMAEAESVTRAGLPLDMAPALKGVLHNNLALALRAQRNDQAALAHFQQAQALNPAIPKLDMLQAETLQALKRPEEAVAIFRESPGGRSRQSRACTAPITNCSTGWTAPMTRSNPMTARPGAAICCSTGPRSWPRRNAAKKPMPCTATCWPADPGDIVAAAGAANMLVMLERYEEASAAFDAALSPPCRSRPVFGRGGSGAAAAGSAKGDRAVAQGAGTGPAPPECHRQYERGSAPDR